MKNLLKKITILGLSSLLLFAFSGCGKANTTSDISTLEKTTWVVGLDDTFAPMGFRDSKGELAGFDVDFINAFSTKMNKKVKLQPIDWSMKESELKSGNIDFIWNGYTITDERQQQVAFSVPYLDNSQMIITLAGSNIKTKQDLKGKKVGAQNESSAVFAMEKETDLYASFDGGKAVTFEDNNQAIMDLEAGRIDAVVADEVLLRYYMDLKGKENFAILEDNFGSEQYGIGMRKGDTKMVEAFNKAYSEMKADGTLKAISEKWFGSDITK